MSFRMPAIHPIRLVGVMILALVVAYGAYVYVKPQLFVYAKLKAGVVVESGAFLQAKDIEAVSLPLNRLFPGETAPIAGLLPYSRASAFLAMPVVRRLSGETPLMESDFAASGDGSAALGEGMTGMSIPVDNIVGISPQLMVGDKVHLYASFEDEEGAHSGLLLREMPVIALQREFETAEPQLSGVTIALKVKEAVLLTHALHYGKIHLGRASALDEKGAGIGDEVFAAALMRTKKRWSEGDGGFSK
ncbi:RcpC/CpaB family pilus assembly protein [Brevibacillus fluminis]|uniref:RcpC/CpaB family pilus assembly protein n=1 Tax=Brevibacillus fluminis TaxID=511487 RepID=UPI003F8BDE50